MRHQLSENSLWLRLIFFFPLVSLNLILGINSGLIRLSVYFVGCVVNHSVDQAMFVISPDQILDVD